MKEEVISLEDIFFSLKKRWKSMVLITLLFTVAAGVYSFYFIKPTYEGRVKVFIGKEGTTPETKEYDNADVSLYQNLMKTYAEVIRTKESTKKALNTIGKDTSAGNVSRVLSGLMVSPSENTQILNIAYRTGDKKEIVQILNAVTNTFMVRSKELIPNGNVQVIQPPEEPKGAIGPNKVMNIAMGFLVGLMVSVGIAFLREYLDNTVKKSEELEEILGVPVIGTIPNFEVLKRAKWKKLK